MCACVSVLAAACLDAADIRVPVQRGLCRSARRCRLLCPRKKRSFLWVLVVPPGAQGTAEGECVRHGPADVHVTVAGWQNSRGESWLHQTHLALLASDWWLSRMTVMDEWEWMMGIFPEDLCHLQIKIFLIFLCRSQAKIYQACNKV